MPNGDSCLLQRVSRTLPCWKGSLILEGEGAHRPEAISDQPLVSGLVGSETKKPGSDDVDDVALKISASPEESDEDTPPTPRSCADDDVQERHAP